MRLRFFFISTLIILSAILTWYLAIVPANHVHSLSDNYIAYKYKRGKVSYSYQITRPDNWIELDNLSPFVAKYFLIFEDPKFYSHRGIKYQNILKALRDHIFEGEKLVGHSSISQQFVKNYFLSPERTIYRKLKEACITLKLEKELSKERILELYLNVVEFGEGVYGINDASCFYFNKPASQLKHNQAIYLASLLPNPKKYSSGFFEQKLTKRDKKAIRYGLRRMKKRKIISQEEHALKILEPIDFNCAN